MSAEMTARFVLRADTDQARREISALSGSFVTMNNQSKSVSGGFRDVGLASRNANGQLGIMRAANDDLARSAGSAAQGIRDQAAASREAVRALEGQSRAADIGVAAFARMQRAALTLGAALGAALSVRALGAGADDWSDMQSRIGAAVKDMEAAPRLMQDMLRLANASYSGLGQTVDIFAGNVTAMRDLGYSTQETLDYTEALNHSLVITATKGEQAASVQNNLSRAMAVGKINAVQLEAVLAHGGRVAESLADHLGTNVSNLRALAAEGKITGRVIAQALLGSLEDVRREAGEMPSTIGDGFLKIGNGISALIGSIDQSLGTSATIAGWLDGISKRIGDLAQSDFPGLLASMASGVETLGQVLLVLAATRIPAAVTSVAALNISTGIMNAQFIAGAIASRGLTVALAAKTAAARGLSTAMAMAGGPVGLLTAGIAGLALGMYNAKARADQIATSLGSLRGAQNDVNDAIETFYRERTPEAMRAMVALAEQNAALAASTMGAVQNELTSSWNPLDAQIKPGFSGRFFGLQLWETEDLRQARAALSEAEERVDATAAALSRARDIAAEYEAGIIKAADGTKLLTAEEEKAAEARAKAFKAIGDQAIADYHDTRMALARDPASRAAIAFQKEFAAQMANSADTVLAYTSAMRVWRRAMADALTTGEVRIAQIHEEVGARERVLAQIGAGQAPASDADRLLRQELELRPLIAAAARSEGEEKARLLEVVSGLRQAYALQADQARQQAVRDAFRDQGLRLRDLELELSLLGQTEVVRSRIIALAETEQKIIDLRLDPQGDQAARMRDETRRIHEQTRALEAQVQAWADIRTSAEDAIDGTVDALMKGDLGGAAQSIVQEVTAIFSDLALKNPLKNALLGTDYATMESVGGLSGIIGRLFGDATIDEADLARRAARPVQSMDIIATHVTLSGNLSGIGAGIAANLSNAPMGGLPGSADVQAQIWQFFAGKGLAPHQIAGIMGNVAAESGFDPRAVGDSGNAHGLFQWNDRRHALFDFIGGQQNLGDIQKQLEFAWHELMTSENGPFRRLMASADVRGATEAFVGFERPKYYSAANPAGSLHFDRRLAAAEASMARFESTTMTAQQQLGQLGAGAANLGLGLQDFGAGLSGVLQQAGAQRGLGGMLISGLLAGAGKAIGIPGFARGGWTGPGQTTDVAGLVHAEEYVFDAASTRQIGVANLEAIRRGAMRGYRDGGYVTGGRPVAMPSAGGPYAANDSQPQRVIFEINVSGTGSAEIRDGVHAAIAQAFDTYDRQALPERVKMIVSDRWGD